MICYHKRIKRWAAWKCESFKHDLKIRCNMTRPVCLFGQTRQTLHIFITSGTGGTGSAGAVSLINHRGNQRHILLLAATGDEDERSWHAEQIFGLSGVFVPCRGTPSHTHLLLSRSVITRHKQRMNFRWLIRTGNVIINIKQRDTQIFTT